MIVAERGPARIHTTLPLPPKVKQIDVLQAVRAAALLLITWGHAGLYTIPHARIPSVDIYGIDLFFVISGFIMSWILLRSSDPPGRPAARNFFLRRLIRIYPIYWIFALVGIVRYGHSHLIHPSHIVSFFLIPLPQYPRIFDFSWTLMFEMFFYTCMGITLLVTVRHAVQYLVAAFSLAVLAGVILRSPAPFLRVALSPMLLEFVFGAIIALALRRFGHRRWTGRILFAAGVVLAGCWQQFPTGAATSMQMILAGNGVLLRVLTWGTSAALVVGGAVLWAPSLQSRIGRLLVILGNSSYSAYLASTLVLEFSLRAIVHIIPPRPPMGYVGTLTYMLLMTASVVLVGWLSYQFVEWPLVRALQRRYMPRNG